MNRRLTDGSTPEALLEEIRHRANSHGCADWLLLTKAHNEIARLSTAISDSAIRWIPVGERMPVPGADVLCWHLAGYAEVAYDADAHDMKTATHWMPLPKDPE